MNSHTSSKCIKYRYTLPNGQTNALHSQAYDLDVDQVAHMPLHHLERHLNRLPQEEEVRQFHYHHQQQHHEAQAQRRLPVRQGRQEVNADVVVGATSSVLQHDDSVIDDVELHYQHPHPHPESIPPITEQQHHRHHYPHHHIHPPIIPSPLMNQQHEYQIDLTVAAACNNHQQYPHHQEQQQQQQQDRSSSSVDSTTLLDGKTSSLYDNQISPLSLPPVSKKTSIISTDSDKNENETESRKNKNKKVNDDAGTTEKKNVKRNRRQGKKQQEMEGGDIAVVVTASKKPRRRRYENDLKLEVLEQLKVPHAKFSDVAKRYSIPENTLRDWRKANVAHTIETAQEKNGGRLKANVYDPMRRLTETLVTFFEHNKQQPKYLRQSITTKLVVAKGIEARDKLLKRHDTHPYLDPKEKKALETFIGSDSWAKKFARRADLKMTGARVKELKEEEVNEYHQSLKKMATRVRQAGICYEEVANLLRQAAEKLLRASIIQSTASNRLMGDIAVSNSRNGNDMSRKLNSLRNALNGTTTTSIPDHLQINIPSVMTTMVAEIEDPSITIVPAATK